MSERTYPLCADGEPDLQAMAADLGIGELRPWSKIFITDGTGDVKRICGCDIERGTVRLRDQHDGREFAVDLTDLWTDWRYDSLTFRRRAFLDQDEFVITHEYRPALQTVVEAARGYAAAQSVPDDDLEEAINLFIDFLDTP